MSYQLYGDGGSATSVTIEAGITEIIAIERNIRTTHGIWAALRDYAGVVAQDVPQIMLFDKATHDAVNAAAVFSVKKVGNVQAHDPPAHQLCRKAIVLKLGVFLGGQR